MRASSSFAEAVDMVAAVMVRDHSSIRDAARFLCETMLIATVGSIVPCAFGVFVGVYTKDYRGDLYFGEDAPNEPAVSAHRVFSGGCRMSELPRALLISSQVYREIPSASA